MEKEKLSAIKENGRNGIKGWLYYRALPSIGSGMWTYLLANIVTLPIALLAGIYCAFSENILGVSVSVNWVVATYLLAANLYIIWRCRKKFHLHIRLGNISKMPKYTILALSLLIGIVQVFPMTAFENAISLPDLLEKDFTDLLLNPLGILCICLVGPIAEELLFRGFIFRKMLKWNVSPWYAIIASSILFGIFHLNPAQIPGAFLLGIVMAWMAYRTKSLLPGIIIHVTNNTLCTIITEEWYNCHIATNLPLEISLSLIGTIVFAISILLFRKKTRISSRK